VSGAGRAAQALPTTEVIVTLKAPALTAFGRSLTSARHHVYARELAKDDFALIRMNPPLLYHNDLIHPLQTFLPPIPVQLLG